MVLHSLPRTPHTFVSHLFCSFYLSLTPTLSLYSSLSLFCSLPTYLCAVTLLLSHFFLHFLPSSFPLLLLLFSSSSSCSCFVIAAALNEFYIFIARLSSELVEFFFASFRPCLHWKGVSTHNVFFSLSPSLSFALRTDLSQVLPHSGCYLSSPCTAAACLRLNHPVPHKHTHTKGCNAHT